jgi:hypothetical protein
MFMFMFMNAIVVSMLITPTHSATRSGASDHWRWQMPHPTKLQNDKHSAK